MKRPPPGPWAAALVLALGCGDQPTEVPPDPVASVTVAPALDTLASLNDTVRFAATARDAEGRILPAVTASWSSTEPSTASVDGTGLVTALANGGTVIEATVGEVTGQGAVVVRQHPAAVATIEGDNQGQIVGLPLDSSVVVEARDALGSPVAGVPLRFVPEGGLGSADPVEGVTDAAGRFATLWTLGTPAGIQTLRAEVTGDPSVAGAATATGFADLPDSMYPLAGNNQFEQASLPLPQPIQVRVVDQYFNPVPGAPITFSAADGTLEATEVLTDLDGVASTTWTLGASAGPTTAQAFLPDSAVGDVVNLKGSPVTFQASVVGFELYSLVPTPPIAGQSLTLYGMGFAPEPAGNAVTIGGVAATVTATAQTALTVEVPSFGCTPAQAREIAIMRNGATVATSVLVQPAGALSLNPGGTAVLTAQEDPCLQFLSSGAGGEYLVGITATRPLQGELAFTMTADDGINPPPAPGPTATAPVADAPDDTPAGRDRALRVWESSFSRAHPWSNISPWGAMAAAPPVVGQEIEMRVPGITTDPCNDFSATVARVIAVGEQVVVMTDAALPVGAADSATIAAALDTLVAAFAGVVYPTAAAYFGTPTDRDQNGGIVVLLSPLVGTLGVQAFATAVDLVDRATCPSSNGGEVIYLAAPAEPDAAGFAALLAAVPPDLAHELTHVIQLTRRTAAGGIPLAPWIAEAQAQLGTEVVGFAARGDEPHRDYGAAVVNGDAEAMAWYRPLFDRLSYLFGWDGATGKVTGAPERCSLFGFGGPSVPCGPAYAAGAAWSFLRYVSDRVADGLAGGEPEFHAALIDADPMQDGVLALGSFAGGDLSRLIADWAMTLYADGRVPPAASPTLQVTSWNLADIYGALGAEQQLSPVAFDFTSFARAGSVTGGGTAYTRITAGGAHGALALRVRDGADQPLGDELRPRIWVVRVQ